MRPFPKPSDQFKSRYYKDCRLKIIALTQRGGQWAQTWKAGTDDANRELMEMAHCFADPELWPQGHGCSGTALLAFWRERTASFDGFQPLEWRRPHHGGHLLD